MTLENRLDDIHTTGHPIGHADKRPAVRPGSSEWLDRRRDGIGGSDAAVCLGIQPYDRTRPQLWEHKTGRVDHSPDGSEAIRLGTLLEPYVRDWLRQRADDMPAWSAYDGLVADESTLRHPDRSWQQAHCDGFIVTLDGVADGVEIKTSTIDYEDGRYTWIERVRESHYAQIQHYLSVTGLEQWRYIYVRLPIDDRAFLRAVPRRFDALPEDEWWLWVIDEASVHETIVDRDDDYIDRLVEAERSLWQHVQTDTRPDPWLPEGEMRVDDDELAEWLEEYGRTHATIKAQSAPDDLEAQKEQLKSKIKARAQSIAGAGEGAKKIWVTDDDYVLWHGGYDDWAARPADREPYDDRGDDHEAPF